MIRRCPFFIPRKGGNDYGKQGGTGVVVGKVSEMLMAQDRFKHYLDYFKIKYEE